MTDLSCGVHVRTLYRHQVGDIVARGRRTLVMFHSQYCGYCHETLPHLHRASMRLCGYDVWTVDVDVHEELADKHKIESLPTIILLSPTGKELKRVEGFQETESLVKFAL